jgi:hypothetical protein
MRKSAPFVSLAIIALATPLQAQMRMRRSVLLESGLYHEAHGKILCCDSDHDGRQELIFHTGTINPSDPLRWEVWEYRPVNRYELVYADTGAYPRPPGILTGNLLPFDVGDIDQDGLIDMVGINVEQSQHPDTVYDLIAVHESPDSFSYPTEMVWYYRYGTNLVIPQPLCYVPDLDGDSKREILMPTPGLGIALWENVADNENQLVWVDRVVNQVWGLTGGDFDLDGLGEYVGGFYNAHVCENAVAQQDTYALVFVDSTRRANGHDVFSGDDLDQDGLPEFFIRFWDVPQSRFYLYCWERSGDNQYERTLVDRKLMSTQGSSRSICGDLDGDGVEELVWALPLGAYVYKAVGNNTYEEVWHWRDNHGIHECVIANVHDMNGNGYNDLVLAGSGKTSVFEVEAVRVQHPNGSEMLAHGDTCWIAWETFMPPRCDSVSLFLLTDTVVRQGEGFWRIDTIVTGLSPGDTTCPWVVSDTVLDAAWIVAIAYGPGWQFDRSDEPFRIVPAGMAEKAEGGGMKTEPATPTLVGDVLYVPKRAFHHSTFALLNSVGRKVMELLPGENDVRHIAPGVYFIREEGSRSHGAEGSNRKVVIQR